MGRPTKLTTATANIIVEAIRDGVPRHRAARLAGVDPATFFRWMADGEQAQTGVYHEFRKRVLRASDELVLEAVQVQRKLLKSRDPKVRQAASKFVLAYMFSSEFSTKQQVEATGKDGGPVAVEVAGTVGVKPVFSDAQLATMAPEQLEAALGALLAARQGG